MPLAKEAPSESHNYLFSSFNDIIYAVKICALGIQVALMRSETLRRLGMRKGLAYIIGAAFLLSAIAFAADKPVAKANQNSSRITPVRMAKMNAHGKVVEISEKSIKIERSVKDKVETMEFVLDKPAENIAVNDKVKIAYIEKDGVLVAARIGKIVPKKPGKKDAISEKDLTPRK